MARYALKPASYEDAGFSFSRCYNPPMPNPIRTVGVVVFSHTDVLLVRHGASSKHLTDTYGLPAGRVEEGETSVEAALRELEEETGLTATKDDLIEIPKTYEAVLERKDEAKHFVMTAFRLDRFSGTLRETSETRPEWVSLSDLDAYPLIPNVANAIRDARELTP